MLRIEVKVLDPRWGSEWELPSPATPGSAAVDLRAAIDAPVTIGSASHLIPTGLSIHIADPGVAGLIVPRSGLGHKHGLVLGNGAGLIDSDYQGPLMVSLVSRGQPGGETVIHPGDRIAQLLLVPVLQASFVQVSEFGEGSARGEGGFGHTGKS